MSDLNLKKNKHLTFEDRMEIQGCLDKGTTFKFIGNRLKKDQTTISKEVKKHLTVSPTTVKQFNSKGEVLPPEICPNLLKSPFVCNPCKKRHSRCPYVKQLYLAKKAHQDYSALLKEAREGIPLNKESFYEIDRIVTSKIKKGQRLYHIIQNNDLGVSQSTIYRHLKKGYLSASTLDFPRVVKFKSRAEKVDAYVPKKAKENRTHLDFLNFIAANDISSWVEMDTVIGRVGGKTILTLHFTFSNFMVGILLDNKTSAEVSSKIRKLKKAFTNKGFNFSDVFQIILTDNGGEFSDVSTIENNLDGTKETHLFFCDPCKAYQKPNVEKNHTLFRDIVPKSSSFDNFTQDTVNLIFSHINSVSRKSLNGKTPYELFSFTYGKDLAKLLGISPIHEDEVIQSPKLIS